MPKLIIAASLFCLVAVSIWAGITDHRQDPDTTEILS
jgi:hypothetical protein